MMRRFHKLAPWLMGAAMTTAFLLVLSRISSFRFENSDDMLIVKAFMGFEGGIPAGLDDTRTFLSWPLYALRALAPAVPWFSVYQVALLWLSGTVLVKSLIQMAWNRQLCMGYGAAAGGLFLCAFAAFPMCRITYTTTAALAGAAAVAQFLSIDDTKATAGQAIRGFLVSLLLFMAGYFLRQIALLPCLAYFCLAGLWRCLRFFYATKHSAKPLLATMLALLLTFGVLTGIRELDAAAHQSKEYVAWNEARIDLFDYTSFEQNVTPALTAQSGLSANELALIREWYFMDEAITAEALTTLAQAYDQQARPSPFETLLRFFSGNKRYLCTAALLLMLLFLCAACHTKGSRGWNVLAALLGVLGAAVLLLYLCKQGRVLARVVDCVLLPCAALLFGVAMDSLSGFRRPVQAEAMADQAAKSAVSRGPLPLGKRLAILVACVLCLVCMGASTMLTKRAISDRPDTLSQQREAELEAFALQNPDLLIVRTPNLLRDTRLFPDVSAGIPINLMIWGDWNCRTPTWFAQLALFGIDGEHFTARDWLHPSIVFVTDADAPPKALTAHIEETVKAPISVQQIGQTATLRFYQFAAGEER
ncbi:MAG: hypothetical protein RR379_09295 [Clostridia bacterium]